ncbi:TetR/AcrR family transcriptional regulator [Polaribacter butkevichii]|uniref:HTH tetR-type domain-containing protein n=1 Tax=Polaribacter butkevichii TaxID=218490 RepID=A0A2P6CAJ1_9FLAO|nr:TetR/AcrR family transcriptional regulator [Polaribacter butkevichii]PQJ71909.1 hypothetical protein BTO14_00980 [Polaribacter butkevichii]
MKNTKSKILETSLVLFNKNGLSNISLRSIADEMQISVGNLQYHFKKREEIINALYFLLVENIDNAILINETKPYGLLKQFFNISENISKVFFKYRFFFLDFNMIIREHSIIKKHYRELTSSREKQFFDFIKMLNNSNLIREEVLPNEYQNLFLRFQITSDFWISSANISSKKISKNIIPRYSDVLNQMLFPYLTKKGKTEYLKLTKV